MLTLATETCFLAEADEVWVVAAAPVMTRTATNARMIIFMVWASLIAKLLISNALFEDQNVLATETHSAGIGIIWGAGRDWQHADLGDGDLFFCRSGGALSGGGCSCDDKSDDEGADDVFHREVPRKLYLIKKISLDNQMR
jgi:hypothetical protein